MRVATFNLWGRWSDWPARLSALSTCWPEPKPEVVLLQEVKQDGHGDQAAEVAAVLGYRHTAYARGHTADDGHEGLAILSTRPLLDVRTDVLPRSDPERRTLEADVELDGRRVHLVCAHTVAQPDDVRRRQVTDLLRPRGGDVVLGADLNDVPEVVAPHIEAAGLRDVLADRPGVATWPMSESAFGAAWLVKLGRAPEFSLSRRRLDYLLLGGALEATATGVEELHCDGTYASDHALLWADLRTT